MSLLQHFEEPGWSVAVLPDLQNYTDNAGDFAVLEETVQWLAGESDPQGVRLVIQVGDLTNNNRGDQWRRARRAFSKLDGKLPYVLAVGNHDLGRHEIGGCRFTRINKFFKVEQNPLNHTCLIECFEKGRLENTLSRFRLGGGNWLVLSLEFGPRESVMEWASDVLLRYPSDPVILVTHEYIDHRSMVQTGEPRHTTPETHNSPYTYGVAIEQGSVHCGEEIWEKLVKSRSQIRLVLNGHYRPWGKDANDRVVPADGVASADRRDRRDDGSEVHQHLINAQWAPRGGDGWLKLFRFNDRGDLLRSDLVSPVLEQAAV